MSRPQAANARAYAQAQLALGSINMATSDAAVSLTGQDLPAGHLIMSTTVVNATHGGRTGRTANAQPTVCCTPQGAAGAGAADGQALAGAGGVQVADPAVTAALLQLLTAGAGPGGVSDLATPLQVGLLCTQLFRSQLIRLCA